MTAFWFIVACLVAIAAIGAVRDQIGLAIADLTLLVGLFGLIALADLVISQFRDTGGYAWTVAGLLSLGFLVDSIYGLMAPERRRRRDKWLRSLRNRRRA